MTLRKRDSRGTIVVTEAVTVDYLKKSFSVGLTSKNYRDNWDSVFGGDGQAKVPATASYGELVAMIERMHDVIGACCGDDAPVLAEARDTLARATRG